MHSTNQADLTEKWKATACQQLKTWENSSNPEAYLVNFEAILMEAHIPEEEWMRNQEAVPWKGIDSLPD